MSVSCINSLRLKGNKGTVHLVPTICVSVTDSNANGYRQQRPQLPTATSYSSTVQHANLLNGRSRCFREASVVSKSHRPPIGCMLVKSIDRSRLSFFFLDSHAGSGRARLQLRRQGHAHVGHRRGAPHELHLRRAGVLPEAQAHGYGQGETLGETGGRPCLR